MEVPSEVLEKLKCENCENYLSRGPVLMLDNERSRCGRCLEPEQGGKRNKPYEELAQLMRFPCRYKENGCEVKLSFEENKAHEEACVYKLYLCPIAESGKCEWSGVRGNLLEHCKTEHPHKVIQNPVQFKHDITKSSLGNYLLFAYQVLFLVQTKVCTVSKKIYHSVRVFGDPKLAVKFTYDIEISNENDKLIKRGTVTQEGCLALQEDTSVVLDINGLLTVLGGFKNTIFILTVRPIDGEAEKTVATVDAKKPKKKNKKPTTIPTDNSTVKFKCVQCKSMTEPVYRDIVGWKCRQCCGFEIRVPCRNKAKGCTYTDSEIKCVKHEIYFCSYSTRCELCEKSISEVCLNDHYTQAHGDITFANGTVCYEGTLEDWKYKFIIKTMFGNLICERVHGILYIHSPLPSEQLYMYKCVIEETDQQTGIAIETVEEISYNNSCDWSFTPLIHHFLNHQLFLGEALKINLIKIR